MTGSAAPGIMLKDIDYGWSIPVAVHRLRISRRP